jgi:hypothetical protein
MYICLEACKRGFKFGCRPMLCLDACHLKGEYGGQLLCAIGIDGNDDMFPIAYAYALIYLCCLFCLYGFFRSTDLFSLRVNRVCFPVPRNLVLFFFFRFSFTKPHSYTTQ